MPVIILGGSPLLLILAGAGGLIAQRRSRKRGGDDDMAGVRRAQRRDGQLAPRREGRSMSTIAITGATGFVGSHLRAALEAAGHDDPPAVRPLRDRAGRRVGRRRRHPPRGRVGERPLDGGEARRDPREPAQRHAGRRRRHRRRGRAAAGAALRQRRRFLRRPRRHRADGGRARRRRLPERGLPGVGGRGGARRPSTASGSPACASGSSSPATPRRSAGSRSPPGSGLGGPMGSGRQWWPWVHIDDIVGIALAALADERYAGPVNVTAPAPERQRDVSRTLGRVLHRPALLPAPRFALKLLLGGFEAELIGSRRALPAKAAALGYTFAHPRARAGAARPDAVAGLRDCAGARRARPPPAPLRDLRPRRSGEPHRVGAAAAVPDARARARRATGGSRRWWR